MSVEIEEIRGSTWDMEGWRLWPFQAAQFLYKAGFHDAEVLRDACAIMGGESNWYLKAWHHNVVRTEDGKIARDASGQMVVVSTDLGFVQRNVVHMPPKVVAVEEGGKLAETLFGQHADLATPASAAARAFELYEARGWQPWYAYANGGYRRHLGEACLAVGNFLAVQAGLGDSYLRKR